MNDVALLRSDPEVLADGFRRRNLEVDLDALRELDGRRRRVRSSAEDLRNRQKQAGKEIAALEGDAKEAAIAETSGLAEQYKAALAEADALDAEFDAVWVPLPNPPHDTVPMGHGEEDNVEISTWGTIPSFDFDPLDHVDLGERLDMIDIERAAKVSGSRFAYLKGPAVRRCIRTGLPL